jgi:hypothetical protein
MIVKCDSVKQALAEHLISRVDVQQVRDMCVATIPLFTLDNRWVDVFIEPRTSDFFLIHDAGKAVNELILQGMKITPSVEREFGQIAARMGIAYSDEMFQTGGKFSSVAEKVYAVGMSSALAMIQLLDHLPAAEEDPLQDQIGSILRRWSKKRGQVKQNVKVAGELKQHTFDYVFTPRKGPALALSILNPTAGALSAAERFGFKTKDLEKTAFGQWKRIAVEAKSEVWSKEARKIVEKCANAVLEIPSGSPATYEQVSDFLENIA